MEISKWGLWLWSNNFDNVQLKSLIRVAITIVLCFQHTIYYYMNKDKQFSERRAELEEAQEEMQAINNELADVNNRLEKQNRELQEASNRLRVSEENFRQFAENTNDIFILRDAQKIIYVNNQFERIWGRKKEELFANPTIVTEWIHPDDRKNTEAWTSFKNLVHGQAHIEHFRIIKPDGEVRWLLSRLFLVNDSKGKPYRIVGISSDITEQKDFEKTLRQAKENAQESDLLKTTFLANISHEIRTPMNGIVGFAELLSRDDLDASARKSYVNIMKKSSEQLICIIDDIIDFAKIEANQIRITQEPVKINSMIDQLKIFYDNQLSKDENSHVMILTEKGLKDEEAEILSDELRIRQVLSYLIDNAIKYTSDGFIKIGYAIKEKKLHFFIQDSGIGIPSDKKELVFERFRQGDEGHTRKFGGTGLGLPISKGLVELLGGEIWLESEINKGTTFYVSVPFQRDEKMEMSSVEYVTKEEVFDWKDKLILVAEDDDLNFEFMKALLELTQARVIRAKDGGQAVKICNTLDFDIILMDIRLPVMNGIQVTRNLRNSGIKSPIIAQTAFAMDDDEKKCLEAGCDRYLAKPIKRDKLFSVMNELLNKNEIKKK